MLNKITLIGRLTRDPELRYTTNGKAVARMTIAVDRQYKNKDGKRETDFIPAIAWSKLAEITCEYMKKGKLIAVHGSLQIRQYQDEGIEKYISEVIANDIRFLEPKDK